MFNMTFTDEKAIRASSIMMIPIRVPYPKLLYVSAREPIKITEHTMEARRTIMLITPKKVSAPLEIDSDCL